MFSPHDDERRRPDLEPHLRAYVAALAADRPAFAHLRPEAIVFVAGAARRAARASVRPLAFASGASEQGNLRKPVVRVGGHRVLYEICLRPRFFLGSTPRERALILAQELWHIGAHFDGRLAPERRHGAAPEATLEGALRRALAGFDVERTSLWPLLAVHGELWLPAWLQRPPSLVAAGRGQRAEYDERDLYSALVLQTAPSEPRRRPDPAA